VASLPALVVKVLFDDFLDGADTGWFMGISFLMTGFFLLLAETLSNRMKAKTESPNLLQSIIMGVMQGVALLPGVSRSGSTLAGGLLAGVDRKGAAKFSFMMSAPAIAASLFIEGYGAMKDGLLAELSLLPTLIGIAVAAVSGYLAIRFMLRLITRVSLNWFALYVAILGVAFLVMQLIGVNGMPPFAMPEAAALPL